MSDMQDHHSAVVRLIAEGQYAAAAAALCRSADPGPRDLSLLASLGRACLRSGLAQDAARIFRTCLERRHDAEFLEGLGCALVALGRREEAERCLAEAVRRDDRRVEAWAGLARLGRLRPKDPLREDIVRVMRDGALPATRRRLLAAILAAADAVGQGCESVRFGPA